MENHHFWWHISTIHGNFNSYVKLPVGIMGANNQLLRFGQSSGLLSHPCESKYFEGRYLHPYVYDVSSILRLFVVRKMPSMYNHVYIHIHIIHVNFRCSALGSSNCVRKMSEETNLASSGIRIPESCWPVLTILTHHTVISQVACWIIVYQHKN